MAIPELIFVILTLISFISSNEYNECISELQYHDGYTENVTCSNLEEMHVSPYLCSQERNAKCSITFLGEIEILRTHSFSRMESLEQVFLNDTKMRRLESMAFVGSPNIRFIHLERNQINSIPDGLFLTLSSLEFLDLHENIIEEIEGESLSAEALNYLDLSSNKLRKFSLSTMNPPLSLKFLDLSGNQIADIQGESLENLYQLITLNISNNKLQNLPFGLFKDLENLTYLDISSNNLKTLQSGVFYGAFNLAMLNLSGNNLGNSDLIVFYPLKNVVDIDISDNEITTLDIKSIKLLRRLHSLRIQGNNFTCPKLKDILVEAYEHEVGIPPGQTYNEKNFNGIACLDEMSEYRLISTEKDANYDENILEIFGNLEKEQTNLLKNISNEIKITGQQISKKIESTNKFFEKLINSNKELLETQKTQLKNGSSEAVKEEENKIMPGQEMLRKMDINNQILQRFIESNGVFYNLSLRSSTTEDSKNRAALTAENLDIKNLIISLNELKILLTICTVIMIIFCVVKLIIKLKTNFFMDKYVLDHQELPFIERQHVNIM